MLQIDIAAAKQRLSELIDKAINGEWRSPKTIDPLSNWCPCPRSRKIRPLRPVALKRRSRIADNFGEPQAERVSEAPEKREPRLSLFGSAKGLIWIADDFDE